MTSPKVTVLMSVYNGEKYLHEAIDSIVNQTFRDFEFLIINDASTDRTSEILKSYQDPRIRIINNEKNIGLTRSLNKGLKVAKGEYIARMDADDISTPDRLDKQVAYMDNHPEKALLGGTAIVINGKGNTASRWHLLTEPGLLRWSLLFSNQFIHSAVVLRSALLRTLRLNYDCALSCVQDYDLWQRISRYASVANLGDVVIYRREHQENISTRNSQEQKKTRFMVIGRGVSELLGHSIENKNVAQISRIAVGETLASVEQLEIVGRTVSHMLDVFFQKYGLTPKEEKLVIRDARTRWLVWVRQHSVSFGWKAVRVFHKFPKIAAQCQYRGVYWKLIIKTLTGLQRVKKLGKTSKKN